MQAAAAQKTPPIDSFVHIAIKIPEMVINPPAKVNIRKAKWLSFFILFAPNIANHTDGIESICGRLSFHHPSGKETTGCGHSCSLVVDHILL